LLEFATSMVIQQGGFIPDDPEIAMLKNVVAGQRVAWRDKGEAERKAAAVAVEMRDSLDALLDIFHDRGKLRTLRDALERGGATP
jgi:hypothetical protein